MTTRERRLGRPFPGDYPDPRTAEQREHDGREVHKQAADLTRRGRDVGFRRELLGLLTGRRDTIEDAVMFDRVPSRVGFETLVVAGDLLIHAESRDDPMVRGLVERDGFREEPVECLEGRVVRLAHPDVAAMRLDDLARILRRQGVPASVNHVTPLGPVAKGLGGPEPSEGARPFPAGGRRGADARSDEAGRHRSGRVAVALVDTGIAAEIRADRWLTGVRREDNVDPLDAFPKGGNGFLDFGAGHGTFASGIVQQVAPEADLRVYRALDSDGIGSEVGIACAILKAVREGASIVNLSLGTQTLDDQPLVAVQAALEMIGEEQGDQEVLVVAAAGNFASTRPSWPAAFRCVVAVAGLTADGRPAEWSSRGWWVDCSTVAEGVVSTYVEGRESTEIDPDPDSFGPNAWATWTGTSFAAPQIAGGVARLCQERGLPPRRALRELLRHGRPMPDFGRAVEILPGT